MEKTVKFFKQNGIWYADVPNHTLEENEMVAGSPLYLESLAKGKKEVWVTVSTELNPNSLATFRRTNHDEAGATYSLKTGQTIWICNVTHDVLGEHPEIISLLSYHN